MSKKIARGGGLFSLQPANLDISTYTAQHIFLKNGQAIVGAVAEAGAHTGIITITSPTPAAANQYPSEIKIGDYILVEGIHWEVDTFSGANTATNLATAINNLDGFTATPVGLTIEIETSSIEDVGFELISKTGNMSLSSSRGILTSSLMNKVNPADIT